MDFGVDALQHENNPNEQAGDTEKKELIEREFRHCVSLSLAAAPLHTLSRN
jgi:hypothetical protein